MSAQIELTYVGNIIEKILLNLEENFNVKIHDYIIMPNHVHFVIEILARADTRSAPTIGQIIKTFKTMSTTIISKEIKIGNIEPYNKRFWQRNYYEHIIRNEKEYLKIQEYIINNPYKWIKDIYYKV